MATKITKTVAMVKPLVGPEKTGRFPNGKWTLTPVAYER